MEEKVSHQKTLNFDEPNTIALASAIIEVRRKAAIPDLLLALEDAHWLLHPKPTNADYKAWQTRVGLTPTTEEEDKETAARKAANMRRVTEKLSR